MTVQRTLYTLPGLLLLTQHSEAGVTAGGALGASLGDALGTFLGADLPVALGSALPVGIGGAAGVALVSLIIGTQIIKRKK